MLELENNMRLSEISKRESELAQHEKSEKHILELTSTRAGMISIYDTMKNLIDENERYRRESKIREEETKLREEETKRILDAMSTVVTDYPKIVSDIKTQELLINNNNINLLSRLDAMNLTISSLSNIPSPVVSAPSSNNTSATTSATTSTTASGSSSPTHTSKSSGLVTKPRSPGIYTGGKGLRGYSDYAFTVEDIANASLEELERVKKSIGPMTTKAKKEGKANYELLNRNKDMVLAEVKRRKPKPVNAN